MLASQSLCLDFSSQTPSSTMLGSSPPVDVLEPGGWARNGAGEIAEGKPRSKGGYAYFRHSRELLAQDVLRTRVVQSSSVSKSLCPRAARLTFCI